MQDNNYGMLTFQLADEEATVAAASRFAECLQPGLTVYLIGDLGAGKTSFVRGALRALGHSGAVKSPTYTIVEPYEIAEFSIYHFDLYRLADVEELELMGVRDYFGPEAICFIEWPERGAGFLPSADLLIKLSVDNLSAALDGQRGRSLQCVAQTELGQEILERWK